MLRLVVSDGDQIGPIQQDVRGHENGVTQQTCRHTFKTLRLIFELRHALELTDRRDGRQQPLQFGVLGDMGLHEEYHAVRVDAGREEADRHLSRALGQRRLIVLAGDGMEIHDAIDAVVAALEIDPVLHGAEPVADVQLAGGLNPGKDAWHGGQLTRFRWSMQDSVFLGLTPFSQDRRHARRQLHPRGGAPVGPRRWTAKTRRDFVTEIDRTAERIIAEVLLAAEPGSRIVGEELSPEVATGGLVWIVDPLDGTTNFLHDFPAYAVSIAAVIDGALEAGVVVHVPRNEMYSAVRGGGAWQAERRLSVSDIRDPDFALIGTGFPFRDNSGDRGISATVRTRLGGHQRNPPPRFRSPRPRGRRRGSFRRILGAATLGMGHRRRCPADP